MSHGPHESHESYSPAQVLHDGCQECAQRSHSRSLGIASLDQDTFGRAWRRAADWQCGLVADVAIAEVPLLSALWAVQVQLERRGFPIGRLPELWDAGAVMPL